MLSSKFNNVIDSKRLKKKKVQSDWFKKIKKIKFNLIDSKKKEFLKEILKNSLQNVILLQFLFVIVILFNFTVNEIIKFMIFFF
jgi:hypothetical protein